jgi:TolA-binding protein
MTKILSSLIILFSLTACIKTAEQVNREKRYEEISNQFDDSKNLLGDIKNQLTSLQQQVDTLNGRMEELEHKASKQNSEGQKEVNENVTLLKSQQEIQATQLTQIQADLKEQRAFLEKVTSSLTSMHRTPTPAPRSNGGGDKKKSAREELNEALSLVKKNDYAEARTELEDLIDSKELTPGDMNKTMHGLGRVEFFTKNYDKALVYFSKVYTKYPKSSLAPNSLLYIGRTLQKMNKKDEAKEAYAKLLEDYPDSKDAADAKKEL